MSFQTFLAEAMQNPDMDVEEVSGEKEFDPQEIETGMKEEKEHKDLYDIFKQCADDNKIEMPLSEDDFYLTIVKAHLREDDKYYSKLVECMKKKDEDIKESVENGITFDVDKMSSVVDGFVRFLIGSPKIAITNLSEYQSGVVSGLIPLTKTGEYPKLWNDLYGGFFNVIKKYL